jgi:hypothetical protein
MHIALVARVSGDAVEAEHSLERLASFTTEHPQIPIAFTLGMSAAQVADRRPDLVEALNGRAEYVRTCLGSPDPTVMPDGVLERALQLESDVVGRLGFDSDVLLVATPWPPHLLPRLVRNGVRGLLAPAPALSLTGVLTHLDAVMPVMPFHRAVVDTEAADVVRAAWIAVDELESAVAQIRPGCATTPSTFFSSHAVTGRATLASPILERDFDEELLARKAIRLSTRLADRTADAVIEQVVWAASVLGDPPMDADRESALREGHRRLIEARSMVDRARRRGDDWVKASRLDWDGDGSEDLHIELPHLSLVLDLAGGGSILVLDDKDDARPMGTLIDGPTGALIRFQALDAETLESGALELTSLEESREQVAASMKGPVAGGHADCRLAVGGYRFELSYDVKDVPAGRFGPQLAFDLPAARLRVDGGEWLAIDEEPIAAEGHRFRLADGNDRMILLSTMTPGLAFVRAAAGGVVVWMHWLTNGAGSYGATIDLHA